MEYISVNNFRKILGLKGQGSGSRYVSKGLIILMKNQKSEYARDAQIVDVDKSIEALLNGNRQHQAMAQKALDYFKGDINERNIDGVLKSLNHETVIDHNPPKNQVLISDNSDNFLENNNSRISDHKPSLMEAMRDYKVVDITWKQLQISEKVGKLVPREAVLSVFENIFIQLKKDLLNFSRSTIDAILREKDNPQSAEKILYDGIHQILERSSAIKK
jgi:hypothetical protein